MTAPPGDHPERALVAAGILLPNGFHAVEAIDPDGSVSLWLFDPAAGDDDPAGCGCPSCAPHEQLGRPVPPARCGRPRTDGRPCLAPVARAGEPCSHHGDDDREPQR